MSTGTQLPMFEGS